MIENNVILALETRILQAVNASSPSFTPAFDMYLDQVVGVGFGFRLVVVFGKGERDT